MRIIEWKYSWYALVPDAVDSEILPASVARPLAFTDHATWLDVAPPSPYFRTSARRTSRGSDMNWLAEMPRSTAAVNDVA